MSDLLSDLAQWSVEAVYSLGYFGVFVVVALANVHVPIPSEFHCPRHGSIVGCQHSSKKDDQQRE
jgi:membrane protein DedA with SNARE-associated domain